MVADDAFEDEDEAIASRLARFDRDALARTKSTSSTVALSRASWARDSARKRSKAGTPLIRPKIG
ncbi:MAG TPA: hypothetical protein VGI54_05875 [Solirubrobacteraceae bacterium]